MPSVLTIPGFDLIECAKTCGHRNDCHEERSFVIFTVPGNRRHDTPCKQGHMGKGRGQMSRQREIRISGLSPYCGLHRKKEMKLGEEI